jgi:hypothetical protein
VAFVDESYRANPLGSERAFYSMSAVTFAKEQLDHVREVLTDIAGGLYWHTTDANEAGRGQDIAHMTRFLARQSQWNIVTVETTITPGDDDLRVARSTCLAAISREVQRGCGPDAVRLIVADNNRLEQFNRDDQRTVSQLRSVGDINPNVALYHGRMGQEPLLWAADVVSWSAYRNLAIDDGRWIEPLRDVLTVLDARTGRPVDMKQPQAAAATPGAQQTTGANVRGQSSVVSVISLPGQSPDRPASAFRRGTSVMDDLAARVSRLRRDAGVRGITEGNTPKAIAARAQRRQELELAARWAALSGRDTPPAAASPTDADTEAAAHKAKKAAEDDARRPERGRGPHM